MRLLRSTKKLPCVIGKRARHCFKPALHWSQTTGNPGRSMESVSQLRHRCHKSLFGRSLPIGVDIEKILTSVRSLRTAEVVCYVLLGLAMLAPRFIVSPAFKHTFPPPILKLQARRLAGLPGTQPWLFHSDGPPSRFL